MAAAPAAPTSAAERAAPPLARAAVVALSAYFVVVWGAGFVASRIALEHAAPFTYIGIRYGFAFCVAVVAFGLRARWPATRAEWAHIAVAGPPQPRRLPRRQPLRAALGPVRRSDGARPRTAAAAHGGDRLALAARAPQRAAEARRRRRPRRRRPRRRRARPGAAPRRSPACSRSPGHCSASPAARCTSASSAPAATCALPSASTSQRPRWSCCRSASPSKASPSPGTSRSCSRSRTTSSSARSAPSRSCTCSCATARRPG